jgi:hypothetical protein
LTAAPNCHVSLIQQSDEPNDHSRLMLGDQQRRSGAAIGQQLIIFDASS